MDAQFVPPEPGSKGSRKIDVLKFMFAIPAAIYRSAFRARARKCPPECFLGNFGHLPRSAPKSAFRVLFGVFRPKKRQKALEKHSLGHSERCPKLPKKHSGGHFLARALKALL